MLTLGPRLWTLLEGRWHGLVDLLIFFNLLKRWDSFVVAAFWATSEKRKKKKYENVVSKSGQEANGYRRGETVSFHEDKQQAFIDKSIEVFCANCQLCDTGDFCFVRPLSECGSVASCCVRSLFSVLRKVLKLDANVSLCLVPAVSLLVVELAGWRRGDTFRQRLFLCEPVSLLPPQQRSSLY